MSAGSSPADALARLEELVAAIEALPDDAARETTRAIVRDLLAVHRAALGTIVERVGVRDPKAIEAVAEDPLVAQVLLLHDLHPLGVGARVDAALATIARELDSRGWRAVVVEASGDRVFVRIEHRTIAEGVKRAAADAVRELVLGALGAAAPDVERVDVEVEATSGAFVPADRLSKGARRAEETAP